MELETVITLSSGLPPEMTTIATILTDSTGFLLHVNSRMECPHGRLTMLNFRLQEFMWQSCPGQAGVKENDRSYRQIGGQKQPSQVACVSTSEVLRSLIHHLQTQNRKHETSTHTHTHTHTHTRTHTHTHTHAHAHRDTHTHTHKHTHTHTHTHTLIDTWLASTYMII